MLRPDLGPTFSCFGCHAGLSIYLLLGFGKNCLQATQGAGRGVASAGAAFRLHCSA